MQFVAISDNTVKYRKSVNKSGSTNMSGQTANCGSSSQYTCVICRESYHSYEEVHNQKKNILYNYIKCVTFCVRGTYIIIYTYR